MVKLQTPEFALRNGELIPWGDAVIHAGSEAANRGVSVFEGIKGYWREDRTFGLVQLRQHYERLLRSARLLHIPCTWTFEEFEAGVFTLIKALVDPNEDMWVRATLFAVEGHWGQDTKADLIMTAFRQDPRLPPPIRIGISTWQRSSDNSVSYRIKSTANYQVGRLARIEGRSRDCEEMILLNQWGRVAEATGSAVLMVRNAAVLTPIHTEGALESITVDCVEAIARSAGIEFTRRPIDTTELRIADEICICGTLAELVPVAKIDGADVDPDGPVLGSLRRRFFEIVRGKRDLEQIAITAVPL